jgi:hypothetical protein
MMESDKLAVRIEAAAFEKLKQKWKDYLEEV